MAILTAPTYTFVRGLGTSKIKASFLLGGCRCQTGRSLIGMYNIEILEGAENSKKSRDASCGCVAKRVEVSSPASIADTALSCPMKFQCIWIGLRKLG